jgi:hypothetical protein
MVSKVIFTNILEQHTASIFRVEEYAEHDIWGKGLPGKEPGVN